MIELNPLFFKAMLTLLFCLAYFINCGDAQCVNGIVKGTKTCKCDGRSRFSIWCCEDGQLDEPPRNFPDDTYKLHMSFCGIKHLPEGWCSNCETLQYLDLGNNSIQNITSGAFQGLKSVETLRLTSNNITNIEKGAFKPLKRMANLDIGQNVYLKKNMLTSILQDLPQNKSFNLYFDHINHFSSEPNHAELQGSDVQGLQGLYVYRLSLANIYVSKLSDTAVKAMHTVECLDLKGNLIPISSTEDVWAFTRQFTTFKHLALLDVSSQNNYGTSEGDYVTAHLHDLCGRAQKDRSIPHCVKPNISYSHICTYQNVTINTELTHLYINSNPGNYTFGCMHFMENKLAHISMHGCGKMILTGPLRGLTCLKNLTLTNTTLTVSDPKTLSSLPALQHLEISQCSIKDQILFAKDTVFQAMRVLNLSKNNISSMSFADLQTAAPNLRLLYLDYNKFKAVPAVRSRSLRFLNLSYNSITYLSKEDQENLKEMLHNSNETRFQIDLFSNPFSCTCNSDEIDSIEWIQRYSSKFQFSSYHRYKCATDGRNPDVVLKTVDIFKKRLQCKLPLIAGLGITVLAVTCFGLGLVLAHRKKWVIQYHFFQLRNSFRNGKWCDRRNRGERAPLLQRVYIIYSDSSEEDKAFAQTTIGPIVESLNLTPIYHGKYQPIGQGDDGYFLPGASIYHNACKALQDSVCAIVVVSDQFLDSLEDTYDNETKLAIYFSEGCGAEYLLPVVIRPLTIRKLLTKSVVTFKGFLRLPRSVEMPDCRGDEQKMVAEREKINVGYEQIKTWLNERIAY